MTPNKPTAKQILAITKIIPARRIIRFQADREIAEAIRAEEFGSFIFDEVQSEYSLKVGQRFDFGEVAAYITAMGAA